MAKLNGAHRRVGLLAHQVAEYAIGIALVAVGLHLTGGSEIELAVSGALLLLVNVTSAGRLGAFRVLSPRSHHVADLVIIGLLVVSPIFPFIRASIAAVVSGELLALLLVWIEHATRYSSASTMRQIIDVNGHFAQRAAAGSRSERVGRYARRAGLVAGITRRAIRDRRPDDRT